MLISDYRTEDLNNQVLPRIDGFIKNPFDLLEFIDMVREVAGQTKSKSQPVSKNGKLSDGRILIMEDDPGLRRIYSKALGRTNYKLDLAPTVLDAREMIKKNKYKLFICDIHMGRERGTDLLTEFSDQLRESGTQVIMVSAYGQYRTLTQEMGADFFLEKPISLGTLLTLIDRIMGYENRSFPTKQIANPNPYLQFSSKEKIVYPIERSN
ncbi:MAG: response regulator [Chloroflexi bacterium]|nr:response regulator [Chloroflexota bacterium]